MNNDNATGTWRYVDRRDGRTIIAEVAFEGGQYIARYGSSWSKGATARHVAKRLFDDLDGWVLAPGDRTPSEDEAFAQGIAAMRAAAVRFVDDRERDRSEATEKSMDVHDYGCASCQAAACDEARYIAERLGILKIDPKETP